MCEKSQTVRNAPVPSPEAEGASSVAASISTAEPCEPTGIRAVSIDGNDAVIVVFGAGAGAGA